MAPRPLREEPDGAPPLLREDLLGEPSALFGRMGARGEPQEALQVRARIAS